MSYSVTIDQVTNNIVVTPPSANTIAVTNTNFPITISYNATVIEGGGISDNGIPQGGSAGQVLTKVDSQNYNAEWSDLPETDLTDYATKVYVNSQGFITTSALSGLATETYVDDAIAAIPPSGITDIVEDTTPQLGGNLDVNGKSIVSANNGNITLAPNGTGQVVISGNLQVTGTTTTVNSTTLDVADINITIAKGAANAAAANGGGITLEGPTTAASITYASSTDSWNLNKKTNFTGAVKITSGAVSALNITNGTQNMDFSSLDQSIAFSSEAAITVASGNLSVVTQGSGGLIKLNNVLAASQTALTTQSTSDLILNTNSGTNSGSIRIGQGINGAITLTPNGTGQVVLAASTVKVGSSGTGIISSNGTSTNLVLRTENSSTGLITINSGANANIVLTPHGSGKINLDGQLWPNAVGSNNQVLTTDGSGVLSWVSISSLGTGVYLTSVNDDAAPSLGGALNVNGKSIVSSNNGNIKITPNGTGRVEISGNKLPGGAGTAGQILRTDGAGDTYWDDEDLTIINESEPQTASIGQQWLNPTTQILKVYTAAGWVQVTADDLQY